MTKHFPQAFYWGTATASYQIEGATQVDGRGESIWDRFSATRGKVLNGDTGEPACQSYYLYHDDIAIMKKMNTNAYRFSVAWPRILPQGVGTVIEAGLDYYDRVVDALLEADITPFVTLYHWDLPQALQDQGGWENRATIDAFVNYAEHTVARLGDRVKHWSTFNEPWCIAILSNEIGEHAPGLHDRKIALQVAHNLMVAHGRAMPIIRQQSPDCKAGITLNMVPSYPATDTEADATLARLEHEKFNLWFLDPILGKGYPEMAWAHYGDKIPEIQTDDLEIMNQPLDFLGLNFYTRNIAHDPSDTSGTILNQRDSENVSARDWEIYPDGMYKLLTWLHQDYPEIPIIYIHENGIACEDVVSDGEVHDPQRISYLYQHFDAAHRAIEAGVPLKGYFVWSLLDNFEWAYGYESRFGLTYVNFDTQERILKDSAYWYAKVTSANALVDPIVVK
ncbi:MAG: GH1 family beta-glucosidase [Aggregatilineales bacterium]